MPVLAENVVPYLEIATRNELAEAVKETVVRGYRTMAKGVEAQRYTREH